MTFPSRDDLIDFVYDEARMLDDGRFDEWLALWKPDGMYWMPLDYNQQDAKHVTSLLHEDFFMIKLRVERFKGERTFSQKPKTRCHHVIQRPFIEEVDHEAGRFVTHTPFHYVETRLDDQTLLAANARHELELVDGALKIRLKRVDLLNCDAAFGNIQMFL
ncbi:aromatic-ring-hydroxylating dioxygenase subunit beta [Mesorhizobium sp. CAU 1732]|uniref:aromatic-ring-hydroxylating dioxygenase subunit beta n=1 Tax=Mesorhizobium sp. CAU 1732 TaxID=3140358 RepID=UPI0032612498